MRMVAKTVTSLSPAEYRQVYSLNLRHNGTMQLRLREARKEKEPLKVVLAKEGDAIVGWSLIVPSPPGYRRRTEAWFYVRKSHRRRGVGTKLMARTRKLDDVMVVPWDDRSKAFFNRFDVRKGRFNYV